MSDITVDGSVLLFTFAISIFAGAIFGPFPIVRYAGLHLATALRASGRTLSQSKERPVATLTLGLGVNAAICCTSRS